MPEKKVTKYVCIHGHFYQPPRENAWIDEIQIQDSAAPYHDWNERITEECYAPNTASRLLDEKGRICDIRNNFSDISFNFGPTLLSWLEQKHPKIYNRIIKSDGINRRQYGGQGGAMAQIYNHAIMPLASKADKEIQVYWGIYDFEKRFGRKPEGMWLSETAVDLETLMVLAAYDIKYTVLAPGQSLKWRFKGSEEWHEGIDTRFPYTCKLPDGSSITLFFYNGELSHKVAFGGLLNDGKALADSLVSAFKEEEAEAQLVHIATDGETFGHHHRHGDMALSYAINRILQYDSIEICTYSSFLKKTKVVREVIIKEASSWSCEHGVERWRSDCGCKTGGEEEWNQQWRVGLRKSLDSLKNQLDELYLKQVSVYSDNPQLLLKNYVELFIEKNPDMLAEKLQIQIKQKLDHKDTNKLLRLLEMQRMAQFMFTSCGWFFNDPSGIETIQILQYAKRAIQLGELSSGMEIEPYFKQALTAFKSNMPEFGNGKDIYEQEVEPLLVSMRHLGMHYAVHSIFNGDQPFEVLNYRCKLRSSERLKTGNYQFISGIADLNSNITLANEHFAYFILHLGNQQLMGSTWTNILDDDFYTRRNQMAEKFLDGNYAEIIYMMKVDDRSTYFSFNDLLKDEQKILIDKIMAQQMDDVEDDFMHIHDKIYGLMNHIRKGELQVPGYFIKNLESINSIRLEKLITKQVDQFILIRLTKIVKEIKRWNLEVDKVRLAFLASIKIDSWCDQIGDINDFETWLDELRVLSEFVLLLNEAGIKPDLYEISNLIISKHKNTGFDPAIDDKLNSVIELLNICL